MAKLYKLNSRKSERHRSESGKFGENFLRPRLCTEPKKYRVHSNRILLLIFYLYFASGRMMLFFGFCFFGFFDGISGLHVLSRICSIVGKLP